MGTPSHPLARSQHVLSAPLTEPELLEHFNKVDAKDIARDIARMGQKELQARFTAIYKTPTFSNNNNWLRRKLLEAVGMQPIKPSQRPRSRQPDSSSDLSDSTCASAGTHHTSSSGAQAGCPPEQQDGRLRRTSRQPKPRVFGDMPAAAAAEGNAPRRNLPAAREAALVARTHSLPQDGLSSDGHGTHTVPAEQHRRPELQRRASASHAWPGRPATADWLPACNSAAAPACTLPPPAWGALPTSPFGQYTLPALPAASGLRSPLSVKRGSVSAGFPPLEATGLRADPFFAAQLCSSAKRQRSQPLARAGELTGPAALPGCQRECCLPDDLLLPEDAALCQVLVSPVPSAPAGLEDSNMMPTMDFQPWFGSASEHSGSEAGRASPLSVLPASSPLPPGSPNPTAVLPTPGGLDGPPSLVGKLGLLDSLLAQVEAAQASCAAQQAEFDLAALF